MDNPKEKIFMFRLTDIDRAIQKSAAAVVGLTESDFVRTAVKEKIDRLVGASLAETAFDAAHPS